LFVTALIKNGWTDRDGDRGATCTSRVGLAFRRPWCTSGSEFDPCLDGSLSSQPAPFFDSCCPNRYTRSRRERVWSPIDHVSSTNHTFRGFIPFPLNNNQRSKPTVGGPSEQGKKQRECIQSQRQPQEDHTMDNVQHQQQGQRCGRHRFHVVVTAHFPPCAVATRRLRDQLVPVKHGIQVVGHTG
jgi:hypothetical protein